MVVVSTGYAIVVDHAFNLVYDCLRNWQLDSHQCQVASLMSVDGNVYLVDR